LRQLQSHQQSMYAGLIMLAADVVDFSKFQKRYGLLKRLDFVNFDGFRGFRFLDPPTNQHRRHFVTLLCEVISK